MEITSDGSSAQSKKIDRAEVFSLHKDLIRLAKAQGYAGYLSQKYFHEAIASRLKCQPETIRKILNKGENHKKAKLWKY